MSAPETGPRTPRHSPYATKLFQAGARRGRARERTTSRPNRGRRRGGSSRREPTVLMVFAAIAMGGVIVLAAIPRRDVPDQRPSPRVYRGHVDLVSIDRVGTMFYGVVSQSYFLLDATERRRGLEGLVRRIDSEGFQSLYLTEASGRTVAQWDSSGLELVSDSEDGS